jgi:hypothetical protein
MRKGLHGETVDVDDGESLKEFLTNVSSYEKVKAQVILFKMPGEVTKLI